MSDNNIIDLDALIDKFIYYKNQSGQLLKKDDQKKYRDAINIAADYFEIRERSFSNISDKMLREFYYELKSNSKYSENTIKALKSKFLVFYKWFMKQPQEEEQITIFEFKENEKPMTKTTATTDTKKVNFNLDAKKFKQLSTLEFLRKMNNPDSKITLTVLINEAIDDYLDKHQKEIERIEIR